MYDNQNPVSLLEREVKPVETHLHESDLRACRTSFIEPGRGSSFRPQ